MCMMGRDDVLVVVAAMLAVGALFVCAAVVLGRGIMAAVVPAAVLFGVAWWRYREWLLYRR